MFCLGCTKFNEAHTGTVIAAKLLSIFESYGIQDKVWMVLTDSGANMIKGIIGFSEMLSND